MVIKPLKISNRPVGEVLKGMTDKLPSSAKADSLQLLLTQFGLTMEQAKQFLGLSKTN